jgi:hypothetical protein
MGTCDAPNTPGKAIRILSELKGRERLETIIHECLHAAGWELKEKSVTHAARDIARILWKLGYRDGQTPTK